MSKLHFEINYKGSPVAACNKNRITEGAFPATVDPAKVTCLTCLRLNVLKRAAGEYATALPCGDSCVGIVEFQGAVIVATTKGVYRLEGDRLVAIPFEGPRTAT